jgi:hypothetical protein
VQSDQEPGDAYGRVAAGGLEGEGRGEVGAARTRLHGFKACAHAHVVADRRGLVNRTRLSPWFMAEPKCSKLTGSARTLGASESV